MNKKLMSIIAITITILTAGAMIYNSNIYNNNQQNYSAIKNGEDTVHDYNNKKENKTVTKEKNINNSSMSVKDTADENEQVSPQQQNNVDENVISGNTKENSNIVENATSNDQKNDVPVFKVSKNQIMDKISFTDKAKILSISKSLSPEDFNKLQEDISDDDEKKGLLNAMELLKKRLNNDDFNKMKNIASKFINLDSLN